MVVWHHYMLLGYCAILLVLHVGAASLKLKSLAVAYKSLSGGHSTMSIPDSDSESESESASDSESDEELIVSSTRLSYTATASVVGNYFVAGKRNLRCT